MAILLSNLSKSFSDQLVVNDLSLHIKPGELFVLLGGSGSGKSTVLRLISGLSAPDSGTIKLTGRDVTELPPQKRGVGFVFQNYALFNYMSVRDNVEFGLKLRKVNKAKRRERSDDLLQLVGLHGLGSRLPRELSGGQRQRVALARALAYEPSVLLLDEPFGALDQKIRVQLRRSLKDIQNKLGMTMLLVTHDQEEAFELGDRIGVLEKGRLLENSTPYELYHTPATEQVAVFVGGGNLLVGRAETDSGNNKCVRLGTTLLPLKDHQQEDGAAVRVLIRPECLRIDLDSGPSVANTGEKLIPLGQARIIESFFSGATHRVRVEIPALKGVRPLAPVISGSQRDVMLDVALTSVAASACFLTGSTCFVSIAHYYILPRAGMRFLIATDAFASKQRAVDLGVQLIKFSHGFGTVLNLGSKEATQKISSVQAINDRLRSLDTEANTIEVRSCSGPRRKEFLRIAQQGWFDLVILERKLESSGILTQRARELLHAFLFQLQIPVLYANSETTNLKNILVCSAAGEPGKSLVYFAGRLARHSAGSVRIIHVMPEDATEAQFQETKSDLESDSVVLDLFNVPKVVDVRRGSLAEILTQEASSSDLLVIGAPGQPEDIYTEQPAGVLAFISSLWCNIAVVPMRENG